MGTWGIGNFENDAALDIAGAIADIIDDEINGFLHSEEAAVEHLEAVMACVAIRNTLTQRGAICSTDKKQVLALHAKVLSIYDEEIDYLDPDPNYKEERRLVIEQTLNEALELANKSEGE